MTTPTSNQVPSSDPRDLLFNAEAIDQVVNTSQLSYADRSGRQRKTLAGVVADINSAASAVLAGLGYLPPVAYAASISLTTPNQTVAFGGVVYAPKVADLPFTTSGTFETAKFRTIQGIVATDLAGSSGAQLMGWTEEDGGSKVNLVSDELQFSRRMQPGDFDLSWLIAEDGRKVVIAGDSLSYNRYDFDPVARANAYDCRPGIMSWSFMLRDFIHRSDPWFIHADQLDFIGSNGGASGAFNASNEFYMPFNNRVVDVVGTGASSEVYFLAPINNRGSAGAVLHFVNNPTGDDGLFDVYYSIYPYTTSTFSQTVASGGRTNWQGFEPYQVKVACGNSSNYPVKFILKNFRNADGSAASSPRRAFFSAAGSKLTPVYLTGAGGWTAPMVSADFEARIGQYDADLLILIAGANDRASGTKEAYAAGMVDVINKTLADRPYCKIICMGPMPASDSGYAPGAVLNGSTMREFLGYAKKAVIAAGAAWFDNYEFFRRLDPTIWRFDNVHMKKAGNRMLFDAIVGRYFSAAYGSKEYYDPAYQALSQKKIIEGRRVSGGRITFSFSSGSLTYTVTDLVDPDAVFKAVTRVSANRLRVEFNYALNAPVAAGVRMGSVTLQHTGTSSIWVNSRIATIGGNFIEFYLIDQLANTLVTDASNNGQTYSLIF